MYTVRAHTPELFPVARVTRNKLVALQNDVATAQNWHQSKLTMTTCYTVLQVIYNSTCIKLDTLSNKTWLTSYTSKCMATHLWCSVWMTYMYNNRVQQHNYVTFKRRFFTRETSEYSMPKANAHIHAENKRNSCYTHDLVATVFALPSHWWILMS